MVALIIAIIALQIGQWLYSKKCIDNLKLIAQEWRETAEAYKDEITSKKIRLSLDEKARAFHLADEAKQTKAS